MSGFTQATQKAILDAQFVSGDYVGYSVNGTSETAALTRTAIGGWTAATSADPSVKGNSGALTSANPTSQITVTHTAVFSAATGGTQKTDWQAVSQSTVVGTNGTVTWAAGALTVSLD